MKDPEVVVIKNFVTVLNAVYDPSNYYRRIIFTGLNIRAQYKHKPDFRTWLIYMRSFLRVCKKAGFNSETGLHYWKMFFTVLFRNPKGIEAAVNLAAMFIHFSKQKNYIVSALDKTIDDLEKNGEAAFYAERVQEQHVV